MQYWTNTGYRVNKPLKEEPITVIGHEVWELGNRHVLVQACERLDIPCTWEALITCLFTQFNGYRAIWLCPTREDAIERYGGDDGENADVFSYSTRRSEGAILLCELEEGDGLWLVNRYGPWKGGYS
jgi:hypothetical protein